MVAAVTTCPCAAQHTRKIRQLYRPPVEVKKRAIRRGAANDGQRSLWERYHAFKAEACIRRFRRQRETELGERARNGRAKERSDRLAPSSGRGLGPRDGRLFVAVEREAELGPDEAVCLQELLYAGDFLVACARRFGNLSSQCKSAKEMKLRDKQE